MTWSPSQRSMLQRSTPQTCGDPLRNLLEHAARLEGRVEDLGHLEERARLLGAAGRSARTGRRCGWPRRPGRRSSRAARARRGRAGAARARTAPGRPGANPGGGWARRESSSARAPATTTSASSRPSATASGMDRAWRCNATTPMGPWPKAMVRSGYVAPIGSSENARSRSVSLSGSATHTETTGTPIRAAAARAIPPRTSSVSSEEDTSWLRRARERSRSACCAASR